MQQLDLKTILRRPLNWRDHLLPFVSAGIAIACLLTLLPLTYFEAAPLWKAVALSPIVLWQVGVLVWIRHRFAKKN